MSSLVKALSRSGIPRPSTNDTHKTGKIVPSQSLLQHHHKKAKE